MLTWTTNPDNSDVLFGEPGGYIIRVVRKDGRVHVCWLYQDIEHSGRETVLNSVPSIVRAKRIAEWRTQGAK